ncbi:MAG: hypothetical protein D6738_02100 [Acidobacteria bacterium]|nr:MAG: hypothetical protein D6738_02100 [Acidobacteriota bacterium]
MSDEQRARFTGRDIAEAMAAARRHFRLSRRQLQYEVVSGRKVGPVDGGEPGMIEIEVWPAPGATPGQPEPAPAEHGRDERRRGGGGRRGRSDDRGRGRRDDRRRPREDRHEPEEEEVQSLFPPPEVTNPEDILRTLTAALIDGLDLDLQVEKITINEIGQRVHLTGPDAPALTEADGEGLEALQYLANRLLHKDGRLEVRVSFDADGWREKLEQKLIDKAKRLAREALDSGEVRKLPPLGPYERRLVHLALAEIDGIRTFSTGNGYRRRVNIAPADGS